MRPAEQPPPRGPLRRHRSRRRSRPPSPACAVRASRQPYVLWERTAPVRGHSPCPLIAVRQARQGADRAD